MITGEPGPKWLSWSNNVQHLSGKFHSSMHGFDKFLDWLTSKPYCNDAMVPYPQGRVLVVCLGIGMLLRNIQAIQFISAEEDKDANGRSLDPMFAYLEKSPLEWAHVNVLLRVCRTIAGDLSTCVDQAEHVPDPKSSFKEKKPPSKRPKKQPERYGSVFINEICS